MVDRLARLLREQPGRPAQAPPTVTRRAAVAAVLRPGDELLFIRRSDRDGDPWSGHIAFPGGRVEPRDASLQAAAERETREEVGLDLARHGRVLGPLDQVLTPVQRGPAAMVIAPFVYRLESEPVLALNHEVASVHWFSLQRLLAGEGRSSFTLEWRGNTWQMPCVDLEGVRIWGLTLRMLDDLLERLGAPATHCPDAAHELRGVRLDR